MIRLDVAGFEEFGRQLTIPSKDSGLVRLEPWGTQRHLIREIDAGLEQDVHDFVVLKGGRQIGGTTTCDALSLWWCQANPGIQGMLVSDDDPNRDYRRDVILEMLESLPRDYRQEVRLNNLGQLAWRNRSRLMFAAAGRRSGGNLGRSRGVNYLEADEVGSWRNQESVSALRAALSTKNPRRLYVWNSTARGIGTVFHDMCKVAQRAVTQRFIFLAWWRHEGCRIERTQGELWDRYWLERPQPTQEERQWMSEVRLRYEVEIQPEQLAWYRWQLVEEFFGDEAMLAQEFGCLPEDCFQAFGDKFIAPPILQRLRIALDAAPRPSGYRYDWGPTLDESRVIADDPDTAPLVIWEEPDPLGAYVVSGHPAWSSSPNAAHYVAQVWRVWPDRIVQVAEYAADAGAMYQFAWVLLHLAGAYRTQLPTYFILEVGVTGYRVLEEIQLLERHGYGLSLRGKQQIENLIGSVQHYYYVRPDNIYARTSPIEWKTDHDKRPWILHGLRDTIERDHITIRSRELIDELAAVRRGEEGDSDVIAGAAASSDARVMTAALATECWMRSAMPDLHMMVAPKEAGPADPTSVQQRLVQNYLSRLVSGGTP
jgi:hypothetical protein